MIVLDFPQHSPEWVKARLGIPTASAFHRLITPKTRKASASADGYLHELLAEWMLGTPLDGASSQWMERGAEIEQEARAYYEFQRDVDVQQVGLCLREDGLVGCSPDGLVGDDGLLEIKVPSAAVQMRYLVDGTVEDDHRPQVQGMLWITGRKWADLLAFNPVLPSAIIRCERDEEFIAALASIVEAFVVRLQAAKAVFLGLADNPGDEK